MWGEYLRRKRRKSLKNEKLAPDGNFISIPFGAHLKIPYFSKNKKTNKDDLKKGDPAENMWKRAKWMDRKASFIGNIIVDCGVGHHTFLLLAN
jgi:hypothetical protein